MSSTSEIQQVKQRFGIIGNAPGLNRAIEVALLIAPTDVSVLITGESGVGKESFPQIIHRNSIRKHGAFIAVNCGAIPEGTIDSELFGHKKGSFTDAVTERKGYFEVADGGTIFLDEVGELPLPTQARLLRVLESGEFMKVGSSQVQKTNIRIVAATNVDLVAAIRQKKFREDLYYRLNTVTIELPPLRERGSDIPLLFRKFASDFADKYRMPPIRIEEDAQQLLMGYMWPGNIRQLRNVVERLSVIAEDRMISRDLLRENLPPNADVRHPAIIDRASSNGTRGFDASSAGGHEHPLTHGTLELLYKMIYDLKGEVSDLSRTIYSAMDSGIRPSGNMERPISDMSASPVLPSSPLSPPYLSSPSLSPSQIDPSIGAHEYQSISDYEEVANSDSPLPLEEMEREYIKLVLKHNNGVRKKAAEDLKISERTLYRKLKGGDNDKS